MLMMMKKKKNPMNKRVELNVVRKNKMKQLSLDQFMKKKLFVFVFLLCIWNVIVMN
jgi:hypothetical protein